jgi:toxin-antitoxin system PIN domain toxin
VILADVNVLVYAFRADSTEHDRYRAWLIATVNGPGDLALTDATLTGFLRITTNPRIYESPADTREAMQFATGLVHAPRSRWIGPTASSWNEFEDITQVDRRIRGNLIPDAWLAALAISHRCRLATADRGFARFDGLDWFDPIAT